MGKNTNMKQEVQNLINSKPNGIKLSEMEESLKQSRLLIGYITRKLQEEGKAVKIDNKYYPAEEVALYNVSFG
jgi:hypothetical protein